MIDRYKDNYSEPNYTRLFLLFFLFLASLYFRIGGAADHYADASHEKKLTTAECLLAGLDRNCDVKK